MQFTEQRIEVPSHDHDVIVVLPNGKEVTLQLRPSNADDNYNGSLDLVLPDNQAVTCWQGDDMDAAPEVGECEHIRLAKQFAMELPYGDNDELTSRTHTG